MMLVELMLTLGIMSFLLISQNVQIIANIDKARAIATGQYLVQLQSGVNNCINNSAIDGNSPQPMTFAYLQAAPRNCFPANVSGIAPNGQQFNAQIGPAGCHGSACSGYIYSTSALTDGNGNIRADILSMAVATIGIDGAMSNQGDGTHLTGYAKGYTDNNTYGGNVPGILAIRVGGTSGFLSLLSQYYRRDGSLNLTGPMDANLNDINNVGKLSAANVTTTNLNVGDSMLISSTATTGMACTAAQQGNIRRRNTNDGLLICNNLTWTIVGNAVSGIAPGGACPQSGMTGTDAVGTGYICNGAIWVTQQTFSTAGASCTTVGQAAQSSSTGEQLLCRSIGGTNQYVSMANLTGKIVPYARFAVSDGTIVAFPNCPGGTETFSFQNIQSTVDVSKTPPLQAFSLGATNNGNRTWTVKIGLKDDMGNYYSAAPYNIVEVMQTECSYQ